MTLLKFVIFLFLIYETSFYLVKGQTIVQEKNDCTKLYNYLLETDQYYNDSVCCSNNENILCDNEGYIIKYLNSRSSLKDFKSFPYFSRIEKLYLNGISLKEIPDSILKLTSLKFLFLNNNQIEVIPPTIQNLLNLEELDLFNNNIKELPSDIFNLPNLNYLILDNNFNLNTKIIKFGSSTLGMCSFENINISCYQPRTCNSIAYNNMSFSDNEAEKYLKICTKEEVEEILNKNENKRVIIPDHIDDDSNLMNDDLNLKNDNSNSKNKTFNPLFIIISSIVIGCIVILLAIVVLIKRKRSKSNEFRSNNENILLNGEKIIIDDNNNNGKNNISGINNSDNKQNDLKFDILDLSVILNTDLLKSPTLPEGGIRTSNLQSPGINKLSINSNNLKFNQGLTNTQNL